MHCWSQPYHMSAAALNAFHSLLLKQVTGNNSLSITAYNHPLPRNITAQVNTLTISRMILHFAYLCICICPPIETTFYRKPFQRGTNS